MRLGSALVGAALVLSGCSAQPTPMPPGPTDGELAELLGEEADRVWDSFFPPGSPVAKPEVEIAAFLDVEEWPAAVEKCIADGGAELDFPDDPTYQDTYNYAYYVCMVRYPYPDVAEHYLSEAQLGYLYDYHVTRTVPCLRLLGFSVGAAPEREDFVEGFYRRSYWSPYEPLYAEQDTDWEFIDWKCPPVPGGLDPFHP